MHHCTHMHTCTHAFTYTHSHTHTHTHSHTHSPAAEPLCILLEFAMYGSLKDYLKSVKTGKLPNPQVLLRQAPPTAPPTTATLQVASGNACTSGMTSSVYPATNQQSTLNLCPYHRNQLIQHRQNGTTPNPLSLVSTGEAPANHHHHHRHICPMTSVPLYSTDPASKAHAVRLLRLLNSKYCIEQLSDGCEYCRHDGTQDGTETSSDQLVCSYCGLSEMCVRRACLDDYPYWYHGTVPRNDYYNSYYNYSERKRKGDSGSPFAKTPGSNLPPQPPPVYANASEGEGDMRVNSSSYPLQESVCHCESLPNLNPYADAHKGEVDFNSSSYPPQESVCHCESPPKLHSYVNNAYEVEGGVNSSGYPPQESVCHCESPPNLNSYYNYNLSPSNGCIYCHQYANTGAVGGGEGGGACQPAGTDQGALGGAGPNIAATSTNDAETRLSYFEVLDFALQIARGMEHLEKMKVSRIKN